MVQRRLDLAILLSAAALFVALGITVRSDSHAATHQGWGTGYAMGNLYAGGGQVIQGSFANHPTAPCPSDPAAHWPFGTWIYNVSPVVVTLDQYGDPAFRTSFVLRDVGDYQCQMGSYWADFYFGRFKPAVDTCVCPGVPAGVCYTGQYNNCTNAINWGVKWMTYSK